MVRQFFRQLLRSQHQLAPTVSVVPSMSTVPAGRVTNGLRPGEIEGLRQLSYTESFQSGFESLVVLLVERNTATGLTERDASAYLASVFRG